VENGFYKFRKPHLKWLTAELNRAHPGLQYQSFSCILYTGPDEKSPDYASAMKR